MKKRGPLLLRCYPVRAVSQHPPWKMTGSEDRPWMKNLAVAMIMEYRVPRLP
jgi:hypothetical protein